MVGTDRLLRRLLTLRRGEEGMALPFALLATAATMALAGVAVLGSIDVQQSSHRDSASKNALAAADAGASVALMRLNRYSASLSNASNANCLGVSAEGKLVVTGAVAGWCPVITESVGGGTYSYRVSAMVVGAPMNVVSTGSFSGTSQRVDVTLGAESVERILREEGMVSEGAIKIPGNPKIRVSIGANENIEGSGNSWEICGNARHGTGQTGPESERLSCDGEEQEANVSLPPVSSFIPSEIRSETYNSNKRLKSCVTKENPPLCEADYYSGKRKETVPYNASTRSITLTSQSLTLGGEDYWLCRLSLSGSSHLIMAKGAHVRLFFSTPEECNMSSSEPQITVSGNSSIESTGYNALLGQYDMLSIFMLGGPTSTVELQGNSGNSATTASNQVLLYAPDSTVKLQGNAIYKGPIAGGMIEVKGNPTFEEDAGYEAQGLPSDTLYSRQSYIECSGTAASIPDENC